LTLNNFLNNCEASATEDLTNINEALRMEKIRKKDWNYIPKTSKFPSIVYYFEKIKYWAYIRKFLKYFTYDEDIKIVLLDDIKNNSRLVYYELIKFLGVKKLNNINLSPINEATHYRNDITRKLLITLYGNPLIRRLYERNNNKFLKHILKKL